MRGRAKFSTFRRRSRFTCNRMVPIFLCELRQFEQVSGADGVILCGRIKFVRPSGYSWKIWVLRHKNCAKWLISCSEAPYLSTVLCTVVYKPCGRLFVGASSLFEN